ncbi:MAG TPA: hypothetical protein VHC43_17540 [Mycobacteriales bacterium]|nr:hypothetical protein [Mycobacteriales bacterium]
MLRTTWRGVARSLGIALLAVAVFVPSAPAAAARRASVRPPELGAPLHFGAVYSASANPPRNVAPHPNYLPDCVTRGWRSAICTREALAAIAHARAHEGVAKSTMVLPRNYKSLSVAEQTFVVTDLERVARGLKPFAGLTPTLNTASHSAALLRVDPTPVISLLRLLGVSEYGSIWAGDFGPLASDFDWMYNDGYAPGGSINIACPNRHAPGCWGHRDNILGAYQHLPTLLAGAGTGQPKGQSIAEVMTGGRGARPAFTYTWRQARRAGAHNK